MAVVRHGQLSAQFRSRWNVLLHRYARRPTLQSPRGLRQPIAQCVARGSSGASVLIDAVVILPDHLHAIFTLPPGDSDYPARWRRIKGHFSSALIDASIELKRRSNGSLALWQRRFWEHTIRDDGDFERHADYIHFNPVKHSLVQLVRD